MARMVTVMVVLSGLVFPGMVKGSCPDPIKSTIPRFIKVGGKQTTNSALADPSISYTVVIRDYGNNPRSGEQIGLDFTNCSDLRLCSIAVGGETMDCQNPNILATTNAAGEATFRILGGSTNASPPTPPAIAPGAGLDCMLVWGDCINVHVTVVIYDQDGAVPPLGVGPAFHNGVMGSDLPIVLTEIGAANAGAPYRGRSDYSTDGVVNGVDLSEFLTILGRSNQGVGSGHGCSDDSGVAMPYCP